MGASYFVEAIVKFEDRDESYICERVSLAIDDVIESGRVNPGSFGTDRSTLFGCFASVCPNAECHDGNHYGEFDESYHHYSAGFDASYGWIYVMGEIFDEMLKGCADGSSVDVCFDSSLARFSVNGGAVSVDWRDDYEWWNEDEVAEDADSLLIQ